MRPSPAKSKSGSRLRLIQSTQWLGPVNSTLFSDTLRGTAALPFLANET
jgi:hypothetical protein